MTANLKSKIQILKENKSFTLLWSSQALSRFADAFETLACMFLVLDLTGSALIMGTVMLFSLLPNIIFGPLAGVYADRYSRKKIMVISEFLRGFIILLIPLLLYFDLFQIYYLYIISFVVSTFETFFSTANRAALPNLLKSEHRGFGYSLMNGTINFFQFLGFLFAGVVLERIGYINVYIFDAITFFISGFAVMRMVITHKQVEQVGMGIKGFSKDFIEGLSYLKTKSIFLVIIIVAAIVNFTLSPLQVIMTYSVENVFNIAKKYASYGLAIQLVGSFVGNFLYPSVSKLLSRKLIIVAGIGVIGFGFGMGGVLVNYYVLVGGICLVALAAGLASIGVSLLFADHIDDEFRGRAASVSNVLVLVASPLGLACTGFLIELIGVLKILQIGGLVILLSSVILFGFWPKEATQQSVQQAIQVD